MGRELEERGWSQVYFAKLLGINKSEVNNIIHGRKNLTPRLALRISSAFSTSIEMWLNLQNMYDVGQINKNKKEMEVVDKIRSFISVYSCRTSKEPIYT
ncbi:MAG: HigA family addiction module antidote protein [Candidatus Peribacteria bacterium]|nr:HigA family addiction module antidote protein [Candidatus Peribacteria bacterium]